MIEKKATLRIDRARIQFEQFDDETVMINVENGLYYSLSKSGSEVLGLLEDGCRVDALATALFGDTQEATDHGSAISGFVEDLCREGILIESNTHSTSGRFEVLTPLYPVVVAYQPPVLEKFDEVSDLLLIDPIHMVDQAQGWPKT
jgi:hypothetical protein